MEHTIMQLENSDSQEFSLKNTSKGNQNPFILANTVECDYADMKKNHIIPVFTKDNEPLISHTEFIDIAADMVTQLYDGESILNPVIRLSHPVKNRIPDAKDKPANQLMEWEKTIFYERMMFAIEIPSIQDTISGNQLSLTIGGVKSYTQDNLYSKSMCDQHFKIFIGFKNKVCTNLCVWTDGFMGDLKVKNHGQLKGSLRTLIENFNASYHLSYMKKLTQHSITENQFAQFVGRCRMYNHLPSEFKSDIPPLLFGDQQVGCVVKDFYNDNSFCRDASGNINLWQLYNLFTSANKSTYIDNFLDRSVNAFQLVDQIKMGLEEKNNCWFLN